MDLSIGTLLQARRKDMGITIAEAARLAGIPRAYLSMIEAGKRSPSASVLLRIMHVLSIASSTWLPRYLEYETRCQQMIHLAQALFDEGDLVAARQTLARAFFVSRDFHGGRHNADIYLLLGRVYYAQGLYRRAVRWLRLTERATRHAPPSPLQGHAAHNHAQALAKVGQRLEALSKFDVAIEIFSRFQRRQDLGTAWLAKANVLLAIRMYQQSYEAYRRAAHFLRTLPYHGDALLGEAVSFSALQGPTAARPLFESITQNPKVEPIVRVKAHGNLSTALRQMGEFTEALGHVDKALQDADSLPGPLIAAFLCEKALCHMLAGDRESAQEALMRYKEVPGPKDREDIAAMHIVAGILGIAPPDDPMPHLIEDDYELKLKAALELLQSAMERAPNRPSAPGVDM